MTNSQINLKYAIKNLEAGKLNNNEISFVQSIRDYSKKELNNLSSSDYKLLKKCSDY